MNKTYNHAITLSFAVPNSKHKDWYDCLENEKDKVKKCLIKRVDDIFKYRHEVTNSWDSDEYLEVLEGYDSFDESE